MSASASSSRTPLVVIQRSKIGDADEGRRVVCVEFKQARYPFKWRKYTCAKCGVLRGEHRVGMAKARADDSMGTREEHLPPRKRLMLRYERDQKALAAAAAAAREKGKEQGQLDEGEISWSPAATITKGKRALRRRRA